MLLTCLRKTLWNPTETDFVILNFSWAISKKCLSVCPSVRQNLPWFLFCSFILMVNLCILSTFGLKSDFWPFLGSSMAEICVCEHLLTQSGHTPQSLVWLFKIFWGLYENYPCIFGIFPKLSVCGPHEPSKNGSKRKICDFCDIVRSKPLVAGLFKFGHMSFFGDCR